MDESPEFIKVCKDRGVLKIGIQRPEKLNAFTLSMYEAMTEALTEAARDPQIRVVLIHGTETCFSSGNDLHDFAQNPPDGENSPVFRFLQSLSQLEKPIIAMVSGPAIGIGTTLLLHCDLVYVDETVKLKLPFVPLGLCPEAASSYLLPRLVGYLQASEMLLLGETIKADRALQLGLVNCVFPSEELSDRVMEKAYQLAALPPRAVCLTKSLLKESHARSVADVMSKEGKLFISQLEQPEAQEAISAFIEGRQPNFS